MATYFDDCSSLSGWTEAALFAGTDYSVSGGAIVKSANNLDLLELTAVDSDANRQDAEILVKVKIASLTTTHHVAIVRGTDSGSAATADGYVVALRAAALRTYSKVNGTFTQISSEPKTHSNDTYYWVRLRVNSTDDIVKARSWADGSSEGGTWECYSPDTAVGVVDGYCGLHGTSSSTTHTWAACGVGTNGDTAPSSAGGGAAALESSVSAGATVSAGLTTSVNLAASASATATVSAGLSVGGGAAQLASSVAGAAAVSAALTNAIRCAASVSAAATVSADLTAPGSSMAAAVSASATAAAALTTSVQLAASVSASATAQAAFATSAAALQASVVAAAAVTQATLSGSAAQLAAAVIAQAQAQAAVTTAIRMAAQVALQAAAQATFPGAPDVFDREPESFALLGGPPQRRIALSKPGRQIGALLKGP